MINRRGQTVMEYIILVGIVTVALFFMGPAIKRSSQSMIKVAADQIGNQQGSEQDIFVSRTADNIARDPEDDTGHLVSSFSNVRTISNNVRREGLEIGRIDYKTDVVTTTSGNAVTDLGYTKE